MLAAMRKAREDAGRDHHAAQHKKEHGGHLGTSSILKAMKKAREDAVDAGLPDVGKARPSIQSALADERGSRACTLSIPDVGEVHSNPLLKPNEGLPLKPGGKALALSLFSKAPLCQEGEPSAKHHHIDQEQEDELSADLQEPKCAVLSVSAEQPAPNGTPGWVVAAVIALLVWMWLRLTAPYITFSTFGWGSPQGAQCNDKCALQPDYLFCVQFAHDAYTDRAAGEVVSFDRTPVGLQARVVRFFKHVGTGTEAMLYQLLPLDSNTFIVAYRGTEGASCIKKTLRGEKVRDACAEMYHDLFQTDMNCMSMKEHLCAANLATDQRVHAGFLRAYLSVQAQVNGALQDVLTEDSTLYITGHSLGGALATLSGYDLTCNRINGVLPAIITLGAPGVFKERARFQEVVKPEHYLRAVAKGPDSFGFMQSDMITQLGGGWTFGYDQPTYDYLAVTPDSSSLCDWGRCHIVKGNYLSDMMFSSPSWCGRCCFQDGGGAEGAGGWLGWLWRLVFA
jgi:hypothetical protein